MPRVTVIFLDAPLITTPNVMRVHSFLENNLDPLFFPGKLVLLGNLLHFMFSQGQYEDEFSVYSWNNPFNCSHF